MKDDIIFSKVPFQVIYSAKYTSSNFMESDFSQAVLLCHLNDSTPAHINIWNTMRGKLRETWNQYPRQRLKIRRGKAIIFANQNCLACK